MITSTMNKMMITSTRNKMMITYSRNNMMIKFTRKKDGDIIHQELDDDNTHQKQDDDDMHQERGGVKSFDHKLWCSVWGYKARCVGSHFARKLQIVQLSLSALHGKRCGGVTTLTM